MKFILKAYYSLRRSMLAAQQHDLQIAWEYTKRTEKNAVVLVHYKHEVYKRQNQLTAKREHFEQRLRTLKNPDLTKAFS